LLRLGILIAALSEQRPAWGCVHSFMHSREKVGGDVNMNRRKSVG